MAGLKEIRRRITSVKNTRQITRAMKLVSAAKLKRAQDAALAGRKFAHELQTTIELALDELPESFRHPFLRDGSVEETGGKRLAIIVAGERGLCGAYNTTILKSFQAQEIDLKKSDGVIAIGRRAVSQARRMGWNLLAPFEGLPEDIAKWPLEEISYEVVSRFQSGEYSEVVVYFTRFVSAMTQQVRTEVILPLSRENFSSTESATHVRAKLSPSAEQVFSAAAALYLRSKLREAALESKASEHAARMTAMESATSNASDLIDRLKLFYNRARQSAITRELIDIIGGAEAVG